MSKKRVLSTLFIILLVFAAIFLCVYAIFGMEKLSSEKLMPKYNYSVLDSEQNCVSINKEQIKDVNLLPSYVKDTFIAIEDTRFYKHNGIDKRRVVGAMLNNVKTLKFSQGASTISQQLIKMTHLSNEKTISRKLKEYFLTKKLENSYSKDEILTMYLNNLYFGNNVYGISNAAYCYFGVNANELTINQSASLAAMIQAPNTYLHSRDKLKSREKLVIASLNKNMSYEAEYENVDFASDSNFEVNSRYNSVAISEAATILGKTVEEVTKGGFIISTYLNSKQNQELFSQYKLLDTTQECVVVLVDNENFAILGLFDNSISRISTKKRPPASLIKPFAVYAPALENGIVNLATKINNINTTSVYYKPQNYNKNLGEFVSVRTALKNSLNIPAVNTLNYVGVKKSRELLSKLGVELNDKDYTLALALGSVSEGITPIKLAELYATLGSGGKNAKLSTIRKIEKDGVLLYENTSIKKQVLSEESTFLINDILRSSDDQLFESSYKTGTNGNSEGNFDAYNCTYSKENTVLVWLGNSNNSLMPLEIKGASLPTYLAKSIADSCFKLENNRFKMPLHIKQLAYDKLSLEQKNVVELVDFAPERYVAKEYFDITKQNIKFSDNFKAKNVDDFIVNFDNDNIIIEFKTQEYLNYEINLRGKTKNIIKEIVVGNGKDAKVIINMPNSCSEIGVSIVSYCKFNDFNGHIKKEKIFTKKLNFVNFN